MINYNRIVFVCEDNTCISIMAEAVMKKVIADIGMSEVVSVESRGLVVLFPEPFNPKALQILRDHHLFVERASTRMLIREDMQENTLVLTMTVREKERVLERFSDCENVYTLREFVGESGDVAEPYGGTEEMYLRVYEHVDLMAKMVVERLMVNSKQAPADNEGGTKDDSVRV